MANLYLISGVTVELGRTYPYIGVGRGRTEYRIYDDRAGWFVGGKYTAETPRGAAKILQAINRVGIDSWLDAMHNGYDRQQLKEWAGIR
jgi:hypothetical protein